MAELLQHKQNLLKAYLAIKGAELENRGRDFLELLLLRPAALERMYFTKNAYYIRDRVLVGTSRYYSPRFYFRLGSFNINIENIHLDNKPSKLRNTVNFRRNTPVSTDVKPEHIFRLLEQLQYWFLQVDEDFAEQNHIGEGFTTQQLLESPCSKAFLELEQAIVRKENRRQLLLLHIDKSLAKGDKQLFMRLTNHLKKLTG